MQNFGGQLIFVFISTVIVTAVLSAFAVWRYRKAVLVGMQGGGGATLVPPTLGVQPAQAMGDSAAADPLRWERATHRRVAWAYVLSVASGALLLALLYVIQSDLPRTPAHVSMVGGSFLIAAAPMVAVSLAWSWRRGLLFAAMLLLVAAAGMTLLSMVQRLARGEAPTLDQLYNFVLFFAAAATNLALPLLFLLGSGSARIRGVVPTIFGGLIVFGLVPWAGYWLIFPLIDTTAGRRFLLSTVSSLGTYGPFLLLTLPVAFLAWIRLHRLAYAYAMKRLSDVQLLARMWWLMFVADTVIVLATSTPKNLALTFVGGAAAYLVFPVANRWLFARLGLARGYAAPRTLLLLRTFGFRTRTEKLFDRIASRWRYFGPVSVIAAPDVAARTLDAGDFLGWLTGRVDESFIRSQSDLEERLGDFDSVPDPDGRYRVNEFCCRNDTWQATVVSLMDRADAIVMDLRGLDAGHAGCEFELQQLSVRVDARRVVLVVDRRVPRETLTRTAGEASARWQVLTVERGSTGETNAVFQALLGASIESARR